MLKIVFIIPLLAPYHIPIFQELAKNTDLKVYVIVEKEHLDERIGWNYKSIDGVEIIFIKKNIVNDYKINDKKNNFTQDERHIYSFELRKILKAIDSNIVIVLNTAQLISIFGFHKYKLGVLVEDTIQAQSGKKLVNKLIKRIMLKTADFYCPLSNDAVDYLKYNGISKNIFKTSWSTNLNLFNNLNNYEKKNFIINNKIDKRKMNFIIVANLIPRKGIIEFLSGYILMYKDFLDNVNLYIIGEGPLREKIEYFIKNNNLNNVYILGNIDNNIVKNYLQVMDVFILPTLQDLFSLAIIEAVASKLPLLISKYAGGRELVNEGKNGYVFDPKDKNDIKKKLNLIYNSDLESFSKMSYEISLKLSSSCVLSDFVKNIKEYYYINK